MRYADDTDVVKAIHYPSTFLCSAVGIGVLKLISVSTYIKHAYPDLFKPMWTYFPPIGLIVAFLGAFVAAAIAPREKSPRTGDCTAVSIGMVACFLLLSKRPDWFTLFLLSIAYGFVGFVAGSLVGDIRFGSSPTSTDDGS